MIPSTLADGSASFFLTLTLLLTSVNWEQLPNCHPTKGFPSYTQLKDSTTKLADKAPNSAPIKPIDKPKPTTSAPKSTPVQKQKEKEKEEAPSSGE